MRYGSILGLLFLACTAAADMSQLPGANASDPVTVHGKVVIKSKQYETMVIVRSGEGDGAADHVFHFWSKPALPVDGGWSNVIVEYTGTSLALIFPERQEVTTFTVAGATPPAGRTPEGFSGTGYAVAGLSHEIEGGASRHSVRAGGVTPHDVCNCDEAGFELPDPWDYNASGGSCTSGGVFALSCSQSNSSGSCSVSCPSGTYACCVAGNPPSCTCRAKL
jgi:hypothetical protein